MGAPFDNLVSFVDCHLTPQQEQAVMLAFTTMSGIPKSTISCTKTTGSCFKGALLVNSIAQFASNYNDAKTVIKANIV